MAIYNTDEDPNVTMWNRQNEKEMNNSNKTTRELAQIWWGKLPEKDREILLTYHTNLGTLKDINSMTQSVETIYLSEHPQTEQPKPEVDEDKDIEKLEQQLWDEPTGAPTSKPEVLEGNKGAKWYLLPASFKPLRGFNEIVIAEMDIDFTNELAKENKELKNRIDYVEKVSFESAKDYALLKEANERMKEALQEVAEFLHVLPMLRLGDKEGFDKCVNIDGVKELESKAKEALQANPNK